MYDRLPACQKAKDYYPNEQEFKAIEAAIRGDKRPEVCQRGIIIRFLHLGHKPKEVAQMKAVSIPTIYGWYNRWRQDGIDLRPENSSNLYVRIRP